MRYEVNLIEKDGSKATVDMFAHQAGALQEYRHWMAIVRFPQRIEVRDSKQGRVIRSFTGTKGPQHKGAAG